MRILCAALSVETLAEAKAALAAGEGISDANIKHSLGAWSAGTEGRAPHGLDEWAVDKGFAHVVWTALKSKIGTEHRTPSVAEVLAHLSGLSSHDRDVTGLKSMCG